jgi:nitroreductase
VLPDANAPVQMLASIGRNGVGHVLGSGIVRTLSKSAATVRGAPINGDVGMSVPSQDLVSFLRGLRAAKEYSSESATDHEIESILEVGRWTASGGNRQPTEVVVIRDGALKQQMGEWGARPAATAAVVFLLIVKDDGSALDEGRMAERLCLGAAAVGLGSTVATLKNEGPDEIKKLLGIPSEHRARTLIAVGHPDTSAPKQPPRSPVGRKPLAEYAHFDRF